jgi:hypothetical protein
MNGEIPSTCSLNSSRNSSLIISDFQEQRSNPACPVGVAMSRINASYRYQNSPDWTPIGLYEGTSMARSCIFILHHST